MIALHPTYVIANRAAIEDEIERLIGILDSADAPDEDLEPEHDACAAADDRLFGAIVNQEGRPVRAGDLQSFEFSPVLPRYGVDQSAGPINEREMDREHHRRMMEGRA